MFSGRATEKLRRSIVAYFPCYFEVGQQQYLTDSSTAGTMQLYYMTNKGLDDNNNRLLIQCVKEPRQAWIRSSTRHQSFDNETS
jgi:hypothetical protein